MTVHRDFRWAIGHGSYLFGDTYHTRVQAICEFLEKRGAYPAEGLSKVEMTKVFNRSYGDWKPIKVYMEWED